MVLREAKRRKRRAASHSYGWYLRVVMTSVPLGTRQHCALVAYLKARFPHPVFFPAISQPLRGSCMAGYHYLMPTASVAQKRVEECTNRSTAIYCIVFRGSVPSADWQCRQCRGRPIPDVPSPTRSLCASPLARQGQCAFCGWAMLPV